MRLRKKTNAIVFLGLLVAAGVTAWVQQSDPRLRGEAAAAEPQIAVYAAAVAEPNDAVAGETRHAELQILIPAATAANPAPAAHDAASFITASDEGTSSSAKLPANHNASAGGSPPERPHVQAIADIGTVVITPAWPAPKVALVAGETSPPPEVIAPSKPSTNLDSRPIGWLSTNIRTSRGDLPSDAPAAKFTAGLGGPGVPATRDVWAQTACLWHASMLCHQPLYFEEVNLERYGYSTPLTYFTQPFVSAGRFFVSVPALPYMMTAEPVWQTTYTLGEYRPGSCVPNQMQWLPWDVKAAAVEATVVTGAAFVIP